MMSYEDPPQSKLFYMGINIDKRIRKNHPLRKIRELVDFEFIYNEVRDKYGYNGNRKYGVRSCNTTLFIIEL